MRYYIIENNVINSSLQNLLDTEMRKLKLEMQQSMVLWNSVTKEAVLAKHMVISHLHHSINIYVPLCLTACYWPYSLFASR